MIEQHCYLGVGTLAVGFLKAGVEVDVLTTLLAATSFFFLNTTCFSSSITSTPSSTHSSQSWPTMRKDASSMTLQALSHLVMPLAA